MQPQPIKPNYSQQSQRIINGFPKDVKDFYAFHGVQLFGSGFPIGLVNQLHHKLSKMVYDVGDFFEIIDNEEIDSFEVKAKKDIMAEGNVFVIDHAMTFRYPDFRRLIMENSNLVPRLTEMLKYHNKLRNLPVEQQKDNSKPLGVAENFTQIEFDGMQLKQLGHLQFPNNTIVLSLVNNQIQNEQQLIKKLQYLNLKVLWVNSNPIEDSQTLAEYIHNATKIEMYNSKFTKHCTQWTIKFVQKMSMNYAFNQNNNDIYKIKLDNRRIYDIDHTLLTKFPNLASLSLKGHEISDQNHKKVILSILQNNKNLKQLFVDYEAEVAIHEMLVSKMISEQIANRIMINNHSLFCKQVSLIESKIDEIHSSLFRLAGNYRLASTDQLDQSSIWYINDEVGSAIQHDDIPNVKMIPFLYAEDNKMGHNMSAFSLIWPLAPIKAGDLLFKDYLNGMNQERPRSSRLAIWFDLPQKFFNSRFNDFQNRSKNLQKQSQNKIVQFYKSNTEKQRQLITKRSESGQLYPEEMKVLTDHQTVLENLTHKQIKIVKTLQEAQILWMTGALDEQKWQQIMGKYFINQFPFESAVVMKHNLAETVQSFFGNTPFLMRTYNLEKELPQFIGDYKERESKCEDNLWILKPPNMARSMDMIITDNLPLIIKSMETGPKIAQKYIQRPVLRKGRKVDLRYIVLIKSVSPLTMFLYKHFWIRSSNNPYTTDRRFLSTYQTQFTVMNYGNVTDFQQIPYKNFIQDFEKDYAPNNWAVIDDKIKKMLRNTFIAASVKYPKMNYDKSRAIYGIDIMIDEATMQPKLLEITFSPDCKRACEYYPSFYNEVFQTLFLDIIGENMQRII